MGGEDWQLWLQALQQADCLAPGAQTVAYSYIGPESTYPLYRDGTIGYAKEHLHATAETINLQLAEIGGHAWVSVCKALVTKASAYIPVLPVYLGLLMGVMKERGVHEGCIEQMQRLFAAKMYGPNGVVADGNRLIRMDDHELDPAIQAAVSALWPKVTPDNFHGLGDFAALRQDFMQLNGFELPGVDYGAPVNVASLTELTP